MTNKTQLDLQQEIGKKCNIAIVCCNTCPTIFMHYYFDDEIECPDCGAKGEPCDFSDLYY